MRVIISSPEGIIFDEEVYFVTLTLVDGEIGIYPRRENFIGALDEGPIKIRPQNKTLFTPTGLAIKKGDTLHVMIPFVVEATTYEEYWEILDQKYNEADNRIKKLRGIKLE